MIFSSNLSFKACFPVISRLSIILFTDLVRPAVVSVAVAKKTADGWTDGIEQMFSHGQFYAFKVWAVFFGCIIN
jgi:hypothetical protein